MSALGESGGSSTVYCLWGVSTRETRLGGDTIWNCMRTNLEDLISDTPRGNSHA